MATAEQQVEMTTSQKDILSRQSRISETVNAGLKSRYRSEARFRAYGAGANELARVKMELLFVTIIVKGYSAFVQT